MNLSERLKKCSSILEKYLFFISQLDMDVIKNFENRIKHPWLDKVSALSENELLHFDAFRESKIIKCSEWNKLIKQIEEISTFEEVEEVQKNFKTYGNLKKQHELSKIYSHFQELKGKNLHIFDFGAGVGNLSFFLEKELNMIPIGIEENTALIKKGQSRAIKNKSKVSFLESSVNTDFVIDSITSNDLGIGLHTCGNFAVDMINSSIKSNISHITNIGCCYSKIKNNAYNLSSLSNKSLHFNSRALANATLGFKKTSEEIYNYRLRIMNYKFSFYHYVYKTYGHQEFCSMSNSRRSLYQLSFQEFMTKSMMKYYPKSVPINQDELKLFYKTKSNHLLNAYFQAYYAISRYIGEVLEIYILCDRALYLEENGYQVKIKKIFNPEISPRNKVIIAIKN